MSQWKKEANRRRAERQGGAEPRERRPRAKKQKPVVVECRCVDPYWLALFPEWVAWRTYGRYRNLRDAEQAIEAARQCAGGTRARDEYRIKPAKGEAKP